MPTDHALHTFMAQISDEMASEYERIYSRAAEDPGTAGDEGEENWAALLREWLPTNYHVRTKGRLISHTGEMSPQIDVLVLKPSYPKKLLEKKIWLADGVAAAFECKNTLTSAHVSDSISRCVKFKDLFKPRSGTPRVEMTSPLMYGVLAHSHSWKGPGSKPVANIESAITDATESILHPRLQIDVLCVADLAAWTSMYIARYDSAWLPSDARNNISEKWGVTTGFVCASKDSKFQQDTFRPIGAFLANLTQRLAWEDAAIRPIADYYRLANLWGSGSGAQKFWPPTIYTDEVRAMISQGKVTNGKFWDDWTIARM